MNPTDNPSQLRADELWVRFVGMFGGDSVERKYGPKPPPEWVAMLGRLKKPEVDRGVRRLAYSGAKNVPSLPDFTRLCRTIGGDEVDEGPRPLALPNPDGFTGDKWDIAANNLLLLYIRTKLPPDPRRYGAPESRQMRDCVAVLVRYKKSWAGFMRDWGIEPETGEVLMPSGPERTKAWHECMEGAETEIAEILKATAA